METWIDYTDYNWRDLLNIYDKSSEDVKKALHAQAVVIGIHSTFEKDLIKHVYKSATGQEPSLEKLWEMLKEAQANFRKEHPQKGKFFQKTRQDLVSVLQKITELKEE